MFKEIKVEESVKTTTKKERRPSVSEVIVRAEESRKKEHLDALNKEKVNKGKMREEVGDIEAAPSTSTGRRMREEVRDIAFTPDLVTTTTFVQKFIKRRGQASQEYVYGTEHKVNYEPQHGDREPLPYITDGNMIFENHMTRPKYIEKVTTTIIKENWRNWSLLECNRLNNYLTKLSETLGLHPSDTSPYKHLSQQLLINAKKTIKTHINIASEVLSQIEHDYHFIGRHKGIDHLLGNNTVAIEKARNDLIQSASKAFEENRNSFITDLRELTLEIAKLKDTQTFPHVDQNNTLPNLQSLLNDLISSNTHIDITNPIPIPSSRKDVWDDNILLRYKGVIPDNLAEILNNSKFREITASITHTQSYNIRASIARELQSSYINEPSPVLLEDMKSRDLLGRVTDDLLRNHTDTIIQAGKDTYGEHIMESEEGSYKKTIDFITNAVILQWSGIAALIIAIAALKHTTGN
jgi:hypothetical protein